MTALVLVGHGSLLDPASASPVYAHADRIRASGAFEAVHVAFWKEQPSIGRALDGVQRPAATVVPVLTSEGYFAEEVFPRELGVDPPGRTADDTAPAPSNDRMATTVRYAPPVGTHPATTDVIAARARAAVEQCDAPAEEVAVAVVGHGTERNERSGRTTRRHAARLRERGRYAAVEPVFLDQSPSVGALFEHVPTAPLVVVPLFVADGHHVTDDVPAAIGLPDHYDPGDGVAEVDGRRVAYTAAVGTAPQFADAIVECAVAAGAEPRDGAVEPSSAMDADPSDRTDAIDTIRPPEATTASGTVGGAGRAFLRWVDAGGDRNEEWPARRRTWGEVAILATDDGYELRHRDDGDRPGAALTVLSGPADLRDRVRVDDHGDYRPLRSARSLPSGWRLGGLDGAGLVQAVRFVYPNGVVHWYQHRRGSLDVTHFREAAGRQTGIYADLDATAREDLDAAVAACCGDCVKRRGWTAADGEHLDAPRGDGVVPCPEPCPFLLDAVRAFRDTAGPGHDDAGTDEAVPAAAFDRPGNRYRRRFLDARRGIDSRDSMEVCR